MVAQQEIGRDPAAKAATSPREGRRTVGGVPITITLAVAIGALVLVSTATVLVLQWRVSRVNTFELVNAISEMVIERLEISIHNHLNPAFEQADYIGREIEGNQALFEDENALFTYFTGALSAAPQITAIGVWDRDLNRVMIYRHPSDYLVRLSLNDSDNADIVEARQSVAARPGAFWGELVKNEAGLTLINLRRPLRRDGVEIGFLVSVIAVPELSELVAETGDEMNATGFVLHGRDRVLAHPSLLGVSGDPSGDEPALPIDAAGDIVLSNLWNGAPVPGFDSLAAEGIKVVEIALGEQAYVALYKSLDDYGEVPWTIGLWFVEEDVDQVLDRLQASALAGIALVVLAIGAAILLGHVIARPIRAAALGTARVGELDLEHVDPLSHSLFRELNEQARAFNAMLVSLRAFETYVPKALVQRLIRHDGEEAVGSEERELTVLFTDVVGFTALSERSTAAEVASFLNEHFALLASCVEAESGTIDKFIGDALMAFWGAPDHQSDTAPRACRAAQAMARAVAADNERREAAGMLPIGIRIGIHTGPVVVGNIGAPGRINYTIVGDSVNIGQRLEALGKTLGDGQPVSILISGATAERLDDGFALEPAGDFAVKGRSEPVKVYRLRP